MLCTGATVSNEAEIIVKIQTWAGRVGDVNSNLEEPTKKTLYAMKQIHFQNRYRKVASSSTPRLVARLG